MKLLPDAAVGFRASNVLAKLDDLCKPLTAPQRIALLQQVVAGCSRRMLDAREKLEAEQPATRAPRSLKRDK